VLPSPTSNVAFKDLLLQSTSQYRSFSRSFLAKLSLFLSRPLLQDTLTDCEATIPLPLSSRWHPSMCVSVGLLYMLVRWARPKTTLTSLWGLKRHTYWDRGSTGLSDHAETKTRDNPTERSAAVACFTALNEHGMVFLKRGNARYGIGEPNRAYTSPGYTYAPMQS
jgi:hypothetical protein